MAELSASTYPTTLETDNLVNQKIFAVTGAHNSSVTTINTSATITGMTAPFYLVNASTSEIIYVEEVDGADFKQVVRGADGSTAASMAGGQLLHMAMVANIHNQLIREMNAMITAMAVLSEPILSSQIFG